MDLNHPALAAREPLPVILWHELRVALPLCIGIAGLLSVLFGDSFLNNLIYSFCIGLSIQTLIECGRFGVSAWLRSRPGRAPGGADNNWPGWLIMLPWIAISAPLGYTFGSLVADLLTGYQHAHSLFSGRWRPVALVLMLSFAVSVAASYFFYARGRMATIEAQAEAARRAAAEIQLKLLESQLEPHMLFNTLANLRVLIGLDPARAQAMLDHLIAFLRATLQASRTGSHALGDEFDRIGDYLELMRIRMGDRLQVQLDLPEALRGLAVPPLLLQPLVENAIQHGLEPKVEGGRIDISARRHGDRLTLEVRDTGAGLSAAPSSAGTGFGTGQVRERLATLYGSRASLCLQVNSGVEGGVVATIELPLPHAGGENT